MKKQGWQRGDKAPGDDTGVKTHASPHRKVFRTRGKYKEVRCKLEDRDYPVSGHRKGFS